MTHNNRRYDVEGQIQVFIGVHMETSHPRANPAEVVFLSRASLYNNAPHHQFACIRRLGDAVFFPNQKQPVFRRSIIDIIAGLTRLASYTDYACDEARERTCSSNARVIDVVVTDASECALQTRRL